MKEASLFLYDHIKEFRSCYALKIGSKKISYEEVLHRALTLSAFLIDNGTNKETIGIVGQRKSSSYIGLLGVLFAGCSFTPINPKYNITKINSIIKSSNIRILVGDLEDILALDKSITSRMLLNIIPDGLFHKKIPNNYIDQSILKSISPLKEPIQSKHDDLAYINYTSGSTGTPKGVKVLRSNLFYFLKNMSNMYQLEKGFRASQMFDFSFDPSVADILFTWLKGGLLCIVPEEELILPSGFIVREKINFWNSVPSIANFMIKTGNLEKNSFPELTHSMFCGEQFPIHVAKAWSAAAPNSTIENLYGPTEGTIYITRYVFTLEDEKKSFKNDIVPIGTPFDYHSSVIIDENDKPIEDSQIGEIIFSGPQITNGYLDDQSKTDMAFTSFNWDSSSLIWYRTGDLGYRNSSGDIECIGRKDSQIKIAGRRVEIGEIESALSRFKKTEGVIVVPLKDNQNIVIGCVGYTLDDITKEQILRIRKDIIEFLDPVFFPKKIISISQFPKSMSGKIDRKKLEIMAKDI